MTDPIDPTDAVPASSPEPAKSEPSKFTKEPQPELSLADRRKKAGITRNRIVLWVAGIGLGGYLVITGIVGILTKAR